MNKYTPDFTVEVEGLKGVCPAGEKYAQHMLAQKRLEILRQDGHSNVQSAA